MKISTKGRYALRVMIDLAQQNPEEYTSLKDIAKRQQISNKYLEMIVALLSKGGLLISLRGKSGGYRLAKSPTEYTVWDIITLTEGSLAPVSCIEATPNQCELSSVCKTLPMWQELYRKIKEYLQSVTLQDLLDNQDTNLMGDDYCI